MKFLCGFCISFLAIFSTCLYAQEADNYRNAEISQKFSGLRITPFKVEIGRMQVRVVLKLENVTHEEGSAQPIAVATKGRGPGYSDPFEPKANISSSDGSYFFPGTDVVGLPPGRDKDDWLVIKPGGSVPVSFGFVTSSPDLSRRATYDFSTALIVFRFDRNRQESALVYFPSLKP